MKTIAVRFDPAPIQGTVFLLIPKKPLQKQCDK